jgi:hypothetical protein
MRAAVILCMAGILSTGVSRTGACAPPQTCANTAARLTIYIHNFSDFGDATIEQAGRVTEDVFRRAGLAMQVVNDPMVPANGQRIPARNFSYSTTDLVANILTPQMAAALHVDMSVLGVAPGTGTPGRTVVHVFAHRVNELRGLSVADVQKGGHAWVATESHILGYAIAHEVGHLLLNMARHPSSGIMRGSWKLNELRAIAAGTLRFTTEEAGKLRAEVARRAALAMSKAE